MIRIRIERGRRNGPCAGGGGRLHFEAVNRGTIGLTVYWL